MALRNLGVALRKFMLRGYQAYRGARNAMSRCGTKKFRFGMAQIIHFFNHPVIYVILTSAVPAP